MKILVTGRGTSGSWEIRGVQLGKQIGARVEANATVFKGYDVAVLVKRPVPEQLARLHSHGIPIVWDVVDSWPQPNGNTWKESEAKRWLAAKVAVVKPSAIVAATNAMKVDCDFGLPVLALEHHGRPGQQINPIRREVRTVGYEGGEQYLGWWREFLEAECLRRGWAFVTNPSSLSDIDIVVAVRWCNGYPSMRWKSNVKQANAQITRTPCILARESGYSENATGGEVWADSKEEMSSALDLLSSNEERAQRSTLLGSHHVDIEDVAKKYSAWLGQLKF